MSNHPAVFFSRFLSFAIFLPVYRLVRIHQSRLTYCNRPPPPECCYFYKAIRTIRSSQSTAIIGTPRSIPGRAVIHRTSGSQTLPRRRLNQSSLFSVHIFPSICCKITTVQSSRIGFCNTSERGIAPIIFRRTE